MAEQRSDSMKATNVSLTSPQEDEQAARQSYPKGTPHETVPTSAMVSPPDAAPEASPGRGPGAPLAPPPGQQGGGPFPGGETVTPGQTFDRPGGAMYHGNRPEVRHEPKPPFPAQHQGDPGLESELSPRPRYLAPLYKAAGKLEGKTALITGGDSGIGRAVALLYAREGADVAIVYLPSEQSDALVTQHVVHNEGRQCVLIPGDLTDAKFCRECVERTVRELGKLDILVSNAAYQTRRESLEEIPEDQWEETFRTNVFALFHLSKAAVAHMKAGSSIIATSSETGLFGNKSLVDYASTKGAINAFVKSLAQQLVGKGIRVNAVAPGPVWTPLNPADQGMTPDKVAEFGKQTPMGRPAQPEELAPAYVFLASDADSSYVTGVVLPVLGGETAGV